MSEAQDTLCVRHVRINLLEVPRPGLNALRMAGCAHSCHLPSFGSGCVEGAVSSFHAPRVCTSNGVMHVVGRSAPRQCVLRLSRTYSMSETAYVWAFVPVTTWHEGVKRLSPPASFEAHL